MIDRLLGESDGGARLARLVEVVEPHEIVVGWATVELDRAELELGVERAGTASQASRAVDDDEILGARCRLIDGADGSKVILLEPSTEGRLAAALARHGEGPVAAYLLADASAVARLRRAGLVVTANGRGPFDRERLVLGGATSGPFHIVAGLDASEAEAST